MSISGTKIVRRARMLAIALTCLLLAGCSAGPFGRPPSAQGPSRPDRYRPRIAHDGSATALATTFPGAESRGASGAAEPSGTAPATASPTSSATAALDDSHTVVPGYPLLAPSTARAAKAKRVGVPVLMFHAIGDTPLPGGIPGLFVTDAAFSAQMDYLASQGYHPVTLQRVYDYWQGRATLPDKPIVLSFDDGFITDYTYVAPLLAEKRWPAVLFLIVGRHKLRMYPSTVRALVADGWEIDSHTITHTDVPGLGSARLKREVAGSRRRLQKMYGVPVNFFCYPSGRYDAKAIAAVKDAGYLGATTTDRGVARFGDLYTLKRIRVRRGESLAEFRASLKAAR